MDHAFAPISVRHADPLSPVLRALAGFGLSLQQARAHPCADAPGLAAPMLDALPASALGLITGPSGTGKSTLLRAVAQEATRRAVLVVDSACRLAAADRSGHPVAALLSARSANDPDAPLATLTILGAAGLADAGVLARPSRALSGGQRARLSVALALGAALRACSSGTPALVVIDEFASGLDAATARSCAIALARWLLRLSVQAAPHAPPLRVVIASARDDLSEMLRPAVIARTDHAAQPCLTVPAGAPPARALAGVRIAPGTPADYHRLAPLHYRAGPPATFDRVLTAHAPGGSTERIAGVLVLSRPALNAPWRHAAWPGDYAQPSPRDRAAAVNRDIRTISRLIVDPRDRASGVGSALVRAALRAAPTRRTEVIAAMGALCPVFSAAGMRPVEQPPSARDARLRRALLTAGLQPWELVDADRAAECVHAHPPLERALRLWADASRATRKLRRADLHPLINAAAKAIAAPRRVYVFDRKTDSVL